MPASCCHSKSASKLFSFFAARSRKRFEERGFEPSQEHLLSGLEQIGYSGSTLLEIGCGVGHLHQTMLEKGAESATGIDLAPKMLSEARDWADKRGLAGRASYVEGDFMEIDSQVDAADVCVLDKVVCCYPDAKGLLQRSLQKTRRTYALTYPRDRWFVRLGVSIWNSVLWLVRSDFRSFVHDPGKIENWISEAGLEKKFEDQTTAWQTQVYVRV
jgi:magnesium-protoporphyrin O-methyltransferase